MAEVTYYFNSKDGVYHWTNDPAYMVDGILTNYATTSQDGDRETLDGTTCPGDDLGTITKVEVRAYGYGDGDDRIDFAFNMGSTPEYETTMPGAPGWGAYVDVTADPNVGGWTWAKIQSLPGKLFVEYDKSGKGNTMYCAKVEIRVTYTPPGPPGDPTQYLAGNDLPVFPHEMDVKSDKLPCPPPY